MRAIRRCNYILLFCVVLDCIIANGIVNNSYGADIMNPLYELYNCKMLNPQKYDIDSGLFGTGILADPSSNVSIFPVPQDNAVGTNDMSNSITVFSFHKDSMRRHRYFKNAVDDLGGGGQFLPVVSPGVIGFGQTRTFIIFNFNRNIHHEFPIIVSLGATIEKVAIADGQKRWFLFEVEKHSGKSPDPWDTSKSLLLVDLSGEKAKVIKTYSKPTGVTWSTSHDKLFLYNFGKQQLQVFNMNFEPTHHPLVDIVRNKKIAFDRILVHPFLPFALLYDGSMGASVASWDNNRDHSPHHLIVNATQFSFSPDGKWVTFQNDFSDPMETYVMPVSEKYPHYFGSPIFLGKVFFEPYRCAWTTNPVSFVGSWLEEIYRWDLSKEAHPECKLATFHDCVVEEDLQKLAKERRQGLGAKGR